MTKQRKSWLARKFLMKRTSAISEFGLEADIEALANNSTQVAFLDPSEFQQGDQIGQGEYSLIYSIQGFCLEDSNTSKHNNNNNNNKLSPEEAAAATEMRKRREQIKEGALTNGPEQFILKKFNKKYLKDKATLKRGAVKLITEARVLGMLQGETTHSVTLKAMNLDVLDGIRDFENFFLLTDRLNDTLANRIDCWRKESIDKGEAPNDDRIPMKSNYAYQIAKAVKACHDNGIMVCTLFFCACALLI